MYYHPQNTRCGFGVRVAVRNSVMSFDPAFKVFIEVFSTILNSLREAVTMFPRVETLLNIRCGNTDRTLLAVRMLSILHLLPRD